jgi:hypothetical protein
MDHREVSLGNQQSFVHEISLPDVIENLLGVQVRLLRVD